jgi:hypothetical protein
MTKPVLLQFKDVLHRVKRLKSMPEYCNGATIGGIKVRATVGHAHLMLLVKLAWMEFAWQ